jgi:hypothetical protein
VLEGHLALVRILPLVLVGGIGGSGAREPAREHIVVAGWYVDRGVCSVTPIADRYGAAQYERGMVRARTRAALAAKRARRECIGAVPYGFALKGDGVHLVAARAEQATIAGAREVRAAGLSLRAVAATLASEGRVSPKGRPFLPAQGRAHGQGSVPRWTALKGARGPR